MQGPNSGTYKNLGRRFEKLKANAQTLIFFISLLVVWLLCAAFN